MHALTSRFLIATTLLAGVAIGLLLGHQVNAQTGITGSYRPAASTTSTSTGSSAEYSKLTKAILSLYNRQAVMDRKNTSQEAVISQLKADNASLKKEVADMKSDVAFDRTAIQTLHQRLTYFDNKSGSINFPQQ